MNETYQPKPIYAAIKRLLDIVLSLLALLALSWFILLVGLLVILTSKGPAFFTHERIGKNGKPFALLKFRTMRHDSRPLKEQLTPEQYAEYLTKFKITNDPRITPFGNFLRKTSIDEIPQLINIFFGQMSFIGPRPLISEETYKFGKDRELLLKVKPGLTGYWAVSGRNDTTYDERVKLELYYVIHRSLWLDIKIFFKTIFVALSGKGAA